MWRYLPLAAWSLFIWGLSADSQSGQLSKKLLQFLFGSWILEPERLAPAQYLIRKAAHFTEFAILSLLASWAMRSRGRGYAYAILFALLDEYHQTFVPGRAGCWSDVGIDASGASLGYLLQSFRRGVKNDKRA
jgi:VanZ family protein